MAVVLRIDQDYDLVTRYGHAFRDRLVFGPGVLGSSHEVLECLDQDAVPERVNAALRSKSVAYVSGMGHGEYGSFTGHQRVPIWQESDSFADLEGSIVHLLSCQAGALLGQAMVAAGVKAFWGYTVDFAFFHDPRIAGAEDEQLAADGFAEPFFHLDAIVDRGVLAGVPASQIRSSITRYVAAVLPKLEPLSAAALLDDALHLVGPDSSWGSADATI